MKNYILRLDDAADRMDLDNWRRMEQLLDYYGIKPLVGVIPNCKDKEMQKYALNPYFWDNVYAWREKGWVIALHGYSHVFCTNDGGINPVNMKSEFAGVAIDIQKEKIKKGIEIFRNHGIDPYVFFAPAHTFDLNTIQALKEESNIYVISDTIANDCYSKWNMTFVPQQSGTVRNLPFRIVTFCYHPNVMRKEDFERLEFFLKKNKEKFINFPCKKVERKLSLLDKLLKWMYFIKRR